VPDEEWQSIVSAPLREEVICLDCFDNIAGSYPYTIKRLSYQGHNNFFELKIAKVKDGASRTSNEGE